MDAVTEPSVLVAVADGVATITLNRPEKRNALSGEMVEDLKAALAVTETDDDVRVVLLRGAGKDFCSGADLSELERIAELGEDESLADARRLGSLFTNMRSHTRPIIAAVQGRALAGGAGLATACDLVLAADDAEMGYPEVRLGFVAAMVMTILRRKVGESTAFELVTRGERVAASRCAEIGLVNRVFPAAEFEESVASYAAELAMRPASAVRLSKQLLYVLDDLGFDEGIEAGARVNVEARLSEACREGVTRFLDRSRLRG
jgi:methylglutaconyl-CoA hydratase